MLACDHMPFFDSRVYMNEAARQLPSWLREPYVASSSPTAWVSYSIGWMVEKWAWRAQDCSRIRHAVCCFPSFKNFPALWLSSSSPHCDNSLGGQLWQGISEDLLPLSNICQAHVDTQWSKLTFSSACWNELHNQLHNINSMKSTNRRIKLHKAREQCGKLAFEWGQRPLHTLFFHA